jgi:hypothetical protein
VRTVNLLGEKDGRTGMAIKKGVAQQRRKEEKK